MSVAPGLTVRLTIYVTRRAKRLPGLRSRRRTFTNKSVVRVFWGTSAHAAVVVALPHVQGSLIPVLAARRRCLRRRDLVCVDIMP